MATWYLINSVTVGNILYKAGKLVDDVLISTGPITSSGGLLCASSNGTVAAAALVAQAMWRQGKSREECDAVMMCAYEVSHDAVVATSPKAYGYVKYSKPLLSELISIVADVQMTNVALTIISQPNVPCKLNVRLVCAGGITAGIVTLVGIGTDGSALTQVIPLTGATRTVVTDDAYATLTSATITLLAGGAAGDHISIGVHSALGLPIPAGATSVAVYKETLDYVNEAVGTVDTTARTIAPTHAADGTHEFEFWYSYALAHTHALA